MRVLSISVALSSFLAGSALAAAASRNVGNLVASQVKSNIANDAAGVIQAFSGALPQGVLDAVNTALNLTVLQKLSGVTNATQLDTLSDMVSKKLAAIENTVHQGITNGSFFGQQQGANYTDLRNCIASVVAQAGVASGQRCLTLGNTAAISDIKNIFYKMVDQYAFQLPMNSVIALQESVNGYLSNSSLLPAAQELINDVQKATLSVAATTNADYVDALYAAESCFFEALAQPVYTKAFEYQCNAGTLEDTESTLDNVQDIYQATVNQYAGVLPPEITQSIQDIGTHYLPQNISKADNDTRNTVNEAILSVVASTAGNTATLVYQLMDCLDLVMIPGAGNMTTQQACLNAPTGVAASRLNIVNGYIQQFYGVLPPALTLIMKDKVLSTLGNSTTSDTKKIKKQLDDMFTASGAGPAYVTCYQQFENCVLNAVGNATASAACALGPKCKTIPFQTAIVDTTSPYSAAVKALQKAKDSGKAKEKQRVSAYQAAAAAASQQAQVAHLHSVGARRRAGKSVAKPKPIKKNDAKSKSGKNKTNKGKAVASKPAKKPSKGVSRSSSGKSSSSQPKSKPRPATLNHKQTSGSKASKKNQKLSHVHFDHKSNKLHRQPSHAKAAKSVSLPGSCSL